MTRDRPRFRFWIIHLTDPEQDVENNQKQGCDVPLVFTSGTNDYRNGILLLHLIVLSKKHLRNLLHLFGNGVYNLVVV